MTRSTLHPETLAVLGSLVLGRRQTTYTAMQAHPEQGTREITTLVDVQVMADVRLGGQHYMLYGLTAAGVQVGVTPAEALDIVRQGGIC